MPLAANLQTGHFHQIHQAVYPIQIASKGYSVRTGRMIMEVGAVTIGFLLGGPVGIGTIILALGTGYVIQPSLLYFKKILNQRINNSLL